jgi:hypothetical protein
MREVITYPLMEELFAILESSVAVRIAQQNFVVDFYSKQI